jgi:hypothetical protein
MDDDEGTDVLSGALTALGGYFTAALLFDALLAFFVVLVVVALSLADMSHPEEY